MAETETLSASTTAMSLSDASTIADDRTQPPVPNLPLPRELRDKIWGYLLYHEHVHTAPYSERPEDKKGKESERCIRSMSRAHTFKFCTNILAVNHQIHQECLKALKSNDFIVVTHESPLRSVTKHATSLPIVTENPEDCTSFRNYALSIDLRAAMATVQETDGSPPKGSFVMVAADLPRFCRVLQRALYDVPAITTYVYNDSADEALRRIAFTAPASDDDLPDIDFGTYLKIHFQEGQVTFELATKVLGAFQRVVHPNLQVSILNCPKGRGPDVIKLKEVMTPKAAWLKAMAWHILEYCQWELAEAKASAEAGHLQNAGVRFGGVVDLNSLMPLFLLPAELDEVYNSDAAIPIALLALTMLDAGVTENILRIRLAGMTYNKTRTITEALNSLCHFLIKLPNSVFAVALSMLGFKLTRTPPPPICRVLEHGWMMNITEDTVIENLANFDMHSSMLQGDAYFDNDYALIKKLAEDEDVYLNPLFEALKQPAGLEGFVDVAHRAKMQKKYPGKYDDL